MNQNQNQNQNQDNKQPCAAAEFGYCSKDDVKDRTVIFMRRNMKLGPVPDEEVNVSMCDFHYKWLVTKNKGVEPLEMRGKFLDTAIGEDLFNAFEPIDRCQSRLFTVWWNPLLQSHIIFNGDDTNHAPSRFERGWEKAGILHFDEDVRDKDNGFVQFLEPISKTVCDHLKEEENKEGKLYFYILPNEGVHTHPPEQLIGVDCWCLEVDDIVHFFENPIDLPNAICNYLNGFRMDLIQKEKHYHECLEFILCEVSEDIMKMPGLRRTNNYEFDFEYDEETALQTREKEKLIVLVERFMNLLKTKDVTGMYELWDSTVSEQIDFASVLWVVYTYTNHHLYSNYEYEERRNYNEQLVGFFVDEGLKKELLTIAISGERQRYVDIHMKTCYNILYESLDVVKALVPAYISTNDTIHHQARGDDDIVIPLTPVSYWYYYDNTVMNICGPRQEYFDKDARILEYLESQDKTNE